MVKREPRVMLMLIGIACVGLLGAESEQRTQSSSSLPAQEIRALYYQIDYQEWTAAPSPLRFHAALGETPAEPGTGGVGESG